MSPMPGGDARIDAFLLVWTPLWSSCVLSVRVLRFARGLHRDTVVFSHAQRRCGGVSGRKRLRKAQRHRDSKGKRPHICLGHKAMSSTLCARGQSLAEAPTWGLLRLARWRGAPSPKCDHLHFDFGGRLTRSLYIAFGPSRGLCSRAFVGTWHRLDEMSCDNPTQRTQVTKRCRWGARRPKAQSDPKTQEVRIPRRKKCR